MKMEYKKLNLSLLDDAEWDSLAALVRESFLERVEANIRMRPNHITGFGLKKWAGLNSVIWVAQQDDVVVALMMYRFGEIREQLKKAYLSLIAIKPLYRHQGIGVNLFSKLEEHAKAENCVYIYSNTSARAKSAIKFHKRCGFEIWEHTHMLAHTNSYSIKFRKYIDVSRKPSSQLLVRWKSFWKSRLKWRESGQMGALYRIKSHMCGHAEPKMVNGSLLTLGQVQQITYSIFEEFVRFCNEHHLRYMLYWGSLLGAVRHQGFIPWDDDIDVSMPLPDYERFIDLWESNQPNSNYQILHGTKNGVGIGFAMFADTRTVALVSGRDREHTRPVAIDIFPAFAVSDDNGKAKKQIQRLKDASDDNGDLHRVKKLSFFEYVYNLLFHSYVHQRVLKKIHDGIHAYEWGSTKRIKVLGHVVRHGILLPADCFDTCINWPFENGEFKIPKQYHDTLKERYGNYMKLPPASEQCPFHAKDVWVSDTPIPERTLKSPVCLNPPRKSKARPRANWYGTRIKLFAVIPFVTFIREDKLMRCFLFSLLPLYSIRKKRNKTLFSLFGLIPLASWKSRS